MKSRVLAIALVLLLLLSLSGCRLAQEAAVQDRGHLVGVLITLEPLDTVDAGNISISPSGQLVMDEAPAQTMDAELVDRTDTLEDGSTIETQEYIFPEVPNAIRFFAPTIPATGDEESYVSIMADSVVMDPSSHLTSTDTGDCVDLKGTLYIAADTGDFLCYYNPVYQREDGSVFALAGSGMSTSTSSVGASFSQKLEDTVTHTENGEATSSASSVSVSVEVIRPPETVTLLQMSGDHTLLHSGTLNIDHLPDELVLFPETEYVVCETLEKDASGNASIRRSIHGPEDNLIEIFLPRPDGLCEVCSVRLIRP